MLLTIIILNYQRAALTSVCLASLYKQFGDKFHNQKIEIVLVDNASGDDSVAKLQELIKKENYTNCHLVENKENYGFGKGINSGAKKARGKYLLFLNNDTIVIDKGIWDMVEYMDKHDHVSILGGKLSNEDGTEQPSVGKFYTPFYATLLMLGLQRFALIDKNPSEIAEVEWVKGGLFMIRRALFEKLHGFDEQIFMYADDMELCYRARQEGIRSYFFPGVNVLHKENASSNRTFAIVNIYRNLLYFYKKHRTQGEYLYLKSLLRTKAVVLMGIGRLLRNSYLVQTYEKAFKVT